jgi:FkbM family methyltransferase
MTAIKRWLIERLPDGQRTRWRYWYRALTRRLDRELAYTRRLLRPGSGVADVGANTGLYTYAFGRTVSVDAFEPLPEAARLLKALATALPRVRVHEVALSDCAGAATLYVPHIRGVPFTELARFSPVQGPHHTAVVAVRTLDEYDLHNIGLIKIDVEGHERQVIRGAAHTIEREKSMLLVEIEQRHGSADITETFQTITALGYRGYFIDGHGRRHPIADFRYERDQEPYIERPTDVRYVNNFLFIHE